MKILELLNELSKRYADLNKTVSMCYLIGSNEMFVENMIIGRNIYLGRMFFNACYHANRKGVSLVDAQKELILAGEEVICIQLGDIYFAPATSDGVIFSKDLKLMRKSYWAIKGVNYQIERKNLVN
ncbi:MAG: hypothetical protein WAW11_05205 [Patescibacteria group bacterium]